MPVCATVGCKNCFLNQSCQTCLTNNTLNTSAMSCVSQCAYNCLTCSSNSSNCTACITTDPNRQNNPPSCSCVTNSYEDSGTKKCILCNQNCLTCTNTTGCVSCATSDPNRLNSPPNCDCATGFYATSANATCLQCLYYCQSCTNGTQCVSCLPGTNRDNTTSCGCLPGFYNSGTNPICQPCPARCQTCTSATSCGTCYTNSTNVRLNDTGRCACPSIGYYDTFVSGNASTYDCMPCPAKCQTCTSSTSCGTCYVNSTNVRLNSTGLCACPGIGYYDTFVAGNASTYDCKACPAPCQTCTSATSCGTCYTNTANVRLNGTGMCGCPGLGYYDTFIAGNVSTYDC